MEGSTLTTDILEGHTDPKPIELGKLDKLKKAKWGGKREGGGRKPSPFTILTGKELRDQFCKLVQGTGDYEEIVQNLINHAKKDPKIGAYILEQLIGKPTQQTDVNVSGVVGVKKLEEELKKISNEPIITENSKNGSDAIQGRDGKTNDSNREPVSDIPTDIQEALQ